MLNGKRPTSSNCPISVNWCSRWQQCFLAGIHRMFLGFRNNYGIVEYLQPLSVRDIEIRAVRVRSWAAKRNRSDRFVENVECQCLRFVFGRILFVRSTHRYERLVTGREVSVSLVECDCSTTVVGIFIYFIILPSWRKFNGVQWMMFSISLCPTGLQTNFPNSKIWILVFSLKL